MPMHGEMIKAKGPPTNLTFVGRHYQDTIKTIHRIQLHSLQMAQGLAHPSPIERENGARHHLTTTLHTRQAPALCTYILDIQSESFL